MKISVNDVSCSSSCNRLSFSFKFTTKGTQDPGGFSGNSTN